MAKEQHHQNQTLAELVCANAGQAIEQSGNAEQTLESLFFAAVCMSRHYMSAQETAAYMRQIADELEKSAERLPTTRLH
ncbi:hypothetical protein CKO15_07630 [Halorhodospira abdelmalekii]|uniref:hypothetical protein n=1 Tax=Halorhodospira abdelmalekii TaxID=421629 RepID=UPI0019044753|nr:hypothetical protein [Halorhodospira abdelmalekii]MBK1735155.1 hypothetical protein [Halorhodospira abdelmalekii]